MKKAPIALALGCLFLLCGCESLYYSAALDKPVYGKEEGAKFDRDAPDLLDRVNKYN
jgi:hypothetical protein